MRGAIASAPTAHLLWTCLAAVCFLWPQALVAALPEGLAGTWRGTLEGETGEVAVLASLLERGDGFELYIALPEVPPLRARLVPGERPQVFEVETGRGGLFDFFDGAERPDPFDGEPLIWARGTAVGIVAYSLEITANGGMRLLRIALAPVDGKLEMAVDRRMDADPRTRFDVLLEPAG